MKRTSLMVCALALVCPVFAQQAVAANTAVPSRLDSLQAQISTNVDVKIAFIADYRFAHSSSERGTKGRIGTGDTLVRAQFKGTDSSSTSRARTARPPLMN